MKFVLLTISSMVLAASMASAKCPSVSPTGLLARNATENYDGTCTFVPRVKDRGTDKYVAGEVNAVCKAFGFGDGAAVDQDAREQFPSSFYVAIGEISSADWQNVYRTITCRLAGAGGTHPLNH